MLQISLDPPCISGYGMPDTDMLSALVERKERIIICFRVVWSFWIHLVVQIFYRNSWRC